MSGQPATAASTPEQSIPSVKGFTLVKKLGSGKSADVYLANQECFDRLVALKILHASVLNDPGFKPRFFDRIKKVKQLKHPNLADVYSVGETNGRLYLVTEYFAEGDINSMLSREQALPPAYCANVFQRVSEALHLCHRQGLLHGNLHNGKIFIRDDGSVAVTDYALARAQIKGKLFNSIHHISPEQLQGKKPTLAVDFYAMGICFYHTLTGKLPYSGTSAKAIAQLHLQQAIPALPTELASFQDVINALLDKQPEQRLQQHQALSTILDTLIHQYSADDKQDIQLSSHDDFELDAGRSGMSASANLLREQNVIRAPADEEPLFPTPVTKSSNKPMLLGAAALVLLITGAGGWYAINNQAPVPSNDQPVPAVTVATVAKDNADSKKRHSQQRIERLLTLAEELMAMGNYIRPIGNNAYGKYQSVLDADTNNARALQGIAAITQHYVTQTVEQTRVNRLAKAQKSLDQAKAIDANAPGLREAEEGLRAKWIQLAERRAAKARQLEDAKQAAKQQALEEAEQLAAEQARLAELQALGAAEEARLAAEQELQRQRDEEQRLKDEAQVNATKIQLNKLKVNGLLNKADTYYKRGEFHSPARENALEKYSQVLAIEPGNTIAQQGLNNVIDTMTPEIQSLLKQQQYSRAKNLYDQAIEAAPQHAALKQLGQSKGW